jgi:hypothetical protein
MGNGQFDIFSGVAAAEHCPDRTMVRIKTTAAITNSEV